MSSSRLRSIKTTLEEVRKTYRFLKVTSPRKNEYTTTRIMIAGHETAWKKNPNQVYSLATGLAGEKEVVSEYLKSRGDGGDPTADEVRKQFLADDLITSKNYQKHKDAITDISRKQSETAPKPSGKVELPPRELIPELFERVREIMDAKNSGRQNKASIIGEYLDKVLGTNKVYRVVGCNPNGMAGDSKLRTAERESVAKNTIYLGKSGELNHFCIPPHYKYRNDVKNFMTLYYQYKDNEKRAEATEKAREFAENLLGDYKKSGRGRSVTSRSNSGGRSRPASRSGSPQSRGSSRSKSPKGGPASPPPSRSPSKTPTRGRSVTPKKTPVRATSSPRRSPSPKVAAKPRIRIPTRK